MQERINNREREREQSLFLGESVRKIEHLYKRRWVGEYSKEKCMVINTKLSKSYYIIE